MRYSEIVGGSIGAMAAFIVTNGYLWARGTSLTDSGRVPEISLLSLLLVCAGAFAGQLALKRVGHAIKESHEARARKLEEKGSCSSLSLFHKSAPTLDQSAVFNRHLGDAFKTAIDRVDKGDTESKGILQSVAGLATYAALAPKARQDVTDSVNGFLQKEFHFSSFFSNMIADKVANFVCNEVIPTMGQEAFVPKLFK